MEKFELGNTGLEVSRIGFGGIPIARLKFREAIRVIKYALECGINFFDSAVGYWDSEAKIGAALRKVRDRPVLASKSPALDADGILADLQLSMGRLGVNRIDLYQLHGVNNDEILKKVLRKGGALQGLKKLKKRGMIQAIGISGHRIEVLKRALETGEFETVQVAFNAVEQEAEDELLPFARSAGIGIIAMKPLAGGVLPNPVLGLKYILSRPKVVPIPGFESQEEIDEACLVATRPVKLTAPDLAQVKQIRVELGTRFCRRCGYCEPCPEGVPISAVLEMQSIERRLGRGYFKRSEGEELLKKARLCTTCGECLSRCPYELPIPEMIRQSLFALGASDSNSK